MSQSATINGLCCGQPSEREHQLQRGHSREISSSLKMSGPLVFQSRQEFWKARAASPSRNEGGQPGSAGTAPVPCRYLITEMCEQLLPISLAAAAPRVSPAPHTPRVQGNASSSFNSSRENAEQEWSNCRAGSVGSGSLDTAPGTVGLQIVLPQENGKAALDSLGPEDLNQERSAAPMPWDSTGLSTRTKSE